MTSAKKKLWYSPVPLALATSVMQNVFVALTQSLAKTKVLSRKRCLVNRSQL